MTSKEKDINKVLAGEADIETARDVARWFATEEGADYLSDRIDDDFKNLNIIENSDNPVIPPCEVMLKEKSIRGRAKLKRNILRIAAFAIPFIFMVSTLFVLNSRIDIWGLTAYEEVYVPKGKEMQIIFQDGSKVFLDSDSRLKYPKKFGFFKREVTLDGQGYFEIKSNKSWPFIVNLSGPTIKVLGTSFNVDAYSYEETVTVQLDEGKIIMNTYSDNDYELKPGDVLTFNKEDKKCSVNQIYDISNMSNWRYNKLSFNDASLLEVIRTLNREYDLEFIVLDPEAWKTQFTIVLQTQKMSDVFADLQYISPLKFNYNQGENKVYIEFEKK